MFDRRKVLAIVAVAGLLLGACGGTAAPSAAPATSAAAAASAAKSAAPSPAQGQLPKPELTTVRIGLSAPTEPVQFAEKLADMAGIYKKNGIDKVEVIGFEGDGKALQALVAGQLDMFVGGSSSAVNSVITETPLKLVSMNGVILTDGLFCGKDVKSAADVKGKKVAVSTFGGTSHGSVLLSLKELKLTPNDVVITQVGGESKRIAALKAGSIACAPIDMEKEAEMKGLGMNLLVDLTRATVQWGRSGLMAKTDFIAKNPNTVLVVVASALEAQNSMWSDPKTAGAKWAQFSEQSVDKATKQIQDFIKVGARTMLFKEDALENPKEVLASVNPKVKDVDVKKAYDLSFLKKLQDNGFYKAHGIPTT